jgi:hypothetical protein
MNIQTTLLYGLAEKSQWFPAFDVALWENRHHAASRIMYKTNTDFLLLSRNIKIYMEADGGGDK